MKNLQAALNFRNLIFLCASTVLIGRGWQHLVSDGPYRVLLWDRHLLEPFFVTWGLNWSEYVESVAMDRLINNVTSAIGLISISLGVLVWTPLAKKLQSAYVASAVWLGLIAVLLYIGKGSRVGQMVEYSSQILAPMCLVFYFRGELNKILRYAPIAIALTFVGHGLYAIGFYPQPGHFLDMTLSIVPVSENTASAFLKVMGALDLIAAALVLFAATRKPALVFCIVWGLATASARLVSSLDLTQLPALWNFGIPESLYRVVHGLMPLAVYTLLQVKKGRQSIKTRVGSFPNLGSSPQKQKEDSTRIQPSSFV